MAAKTLYFKNAAASGSSHGSLQDGGSAPAAATTTTGWNAGQNAIGQACLMVYNTEVSRTSGSWGTTLQPTAALGTSDAWRSENQITGVFANANWTFTFQVRSVSAAYAGRFKLAVRVWRSANADGSGATELTAARIASAATTANLSTSADTQIQFTWSPGATLTLTNEYLFVNVGFEITAAGSGNTQDMDFRVGSTATIVTSDFVQNLSPSLYQDPETVYAPTVAATYALTPSLFTNAQSFFAPSVENLSIAANNPTDGGSTGLAPTLEFTGTSSLGNSLSYEVQVADNAGFASSIVADSYDNANRDSGTQLGVGVTKISQSFTASASGTLDNVHSMLLKTGAPTGSLTANIYAHSGTYGTNSAPTGTVLATSDAVDISTFTTSYVDYTFNFSGANRITLTASTQYCLVFELSGLDASNNIAIGADLSSPTHGGNRAYWFNAQWNHGGDNVFAVNLVGSALDVFSATDPGFANTVSGGDTDPFNSGEKISYTLQSNLAAGTWYWRAKGVAGTPWTTTRSFVASSQGALSPSLYQNAQTFYAPTVAPGAVALTATLHQNASSFFAPTVSHVLPAALYQNSSSFFAPTVSHVLPAALYQNSQNFFAPTVSHVLPATLYQNVSSFFAPTVAQAQTLTASLYQNPQSFFAPTVAPGPVALTPTLYSNPQNFFAPTVAPGAISLVASLYQNASSFFAPTVANSVALSATLYQNASSFFAPTVAPGAVALAPTLYSNASSFFAPTVAPGAVALTAALYQNASSFFAPTVAAGAVALAPPLLNNAQSFPSATVQPGPATVQPGLLSNAQSFYAPTVNLAGQQALGAPFYQNSQSFFAATVAPGAVALTPTLHSNASSFFAPTIAATKDLAATLYQNTQSFFAPSVVATYPLTASLATNASSFFAPTVAPGAVNLSASLFSNAQTFYSPIVGQGQVVIAPNLYTNTQSFYAATVTPGSVGAVAPLVTNTQSFFAPSVAAGAVDLAPSFLQNAQSFYAPNVSAGAAPQSLTATRFDSTQSFYAATVTPGALDVAPSLLTNTQSFFAPSVAASNALVATRFDNAQTFYVLVVGDAQTVILEPPLLINGQVFFAQRAEPFETPADRHLVIAAEDRTWHIEAEPNVLLVPPEDRRIIM